MEHQKRKDFSTSKDGASLDCQTFSSHRNISKYAICIMCLGVFFVSITVLMYEITLTRVFSVLFNYHYSFMAISLSLFGLGLGGLAAYVFWRKTSLLENTMPSLIYITLSLSFSLFFIPQMLTSLPASADMYVYWILASIPFFIAGTGFAILFREFSKNSSLLYFADLVGAGVGCVLVLVFLNMFTGTETVFLIGIFSSMGAIFFAIAAYEKKALVVAISVLLIFPLFFVAPSFRDSIKDIPLKPNQDKDALDFIERDNAKIVETRWSPFGRTDLVESPNDLDRKFLFIDGAAGTAMYKFNENISDRTNKAVYDIPRESGGYLPYIDRGPKNNILIIGSGGGRDVLTALLGGAKRITAVEVNKDTVDFVKEFSDFSGGLYSKFDNIQVIVDEGRSFIKRSGEKYDVIALTLPMTKTGTGASGYSLSENFLFTTESFGDYLNHLTDEGRLVIVTHGMGEVLKLTTTMISALQKNGESIEEAMKHLIVAGPHERVGVWSAFMVRKRPYQQQESYLLHKTIMEFGYFPSFLPYVKWSGKEVHELDKCNFISTDLFYLAEGLIDMDKYVQSYSIDITPPRDDKPFFYKFEVGLPDVLNSLIFYVVLLSALMLIFPLGVKKYFYRTKTQIDWKIRKRYIKQKKYLINQLERNKIQSAEYKKLRYARHPGIENDRILLTKFIPCFLLLGIGFMFIEISLIQKFLLFLGHPTVALSVILFTILVFGGFGSLISEKISTKNLLKIYPKICAIITIWTIIIVAMFPYISDLFLGADLSLRITISVLLLSPLGAIGMPFPMAIRLMSKNHEKYIPWMWGVNGTLSVAGSVFAVAIGMMAGFTYALFVGAAIYIVIAVLFMYDTEPLKIDADKGGLRTEV